MSLKLKRYFWGLIIVCALGFVGFIGLEAYIKWYITNRILQMDKNAVVDFSGNISLKDLSYNIFDAKVKITLPGNLNNVQVNVKKLKYQIFKDNLTNATNITIIDPHATLKADSLHITKNKDISNIIVDKIIINMPNLSGIQVNHSIWNISDNGTIKANGDLAFNSNKMTLSLDRESKQPAHINFTIDNPYYSLSSNSLLDVNNIKIPRNKLDLLKFYNKIKFIKFHLVNKNISGLQISLLNADFITKKIAPFNMYEKQYESAVTRALNNFFNNKQDIYGYFHTSNLLNLGIVKISKPLLVLSNDELPTDPNALQNFRMPADTPENFEPEEQESDANKPQAIIRTSPIQTKNKTKSK